MSIFTKIRNYAIAIWLALTVRPKPAHEQYHSFIEPIVPENAIPGIILTAEEARELGEINQAQSEEAPFWIYTRTPEGLRLIPFSVRDDVDCCAPNCGSQSINLSSEGSWAVATSSAHAFDGETSIAGAT